MKAHTSSIIRAWFCTPFLLVSLLCTPLAAAMDSDCEQPADYTDYFNPVGEDLVFQGLTPKGIQKLEELRDQLRQRTDIFNKAFLNYENVHHAATVARLMERHMFIYGPPGSGKTGVVDWFLDAEAEKSFKIQMHQMMSESAFVGSQSFDSGRKGEFLVNTKGSLVEFKTALIDEADKANAGALAALFSILEEGEARSGNNVIPAETETVFMTSNANLFEIFMQFTQNGMGTMAPALLNRFLFKVFAYNWLSAKDRQSLLLKTHEKKKAKTHAKIRESLRKNHDSFVKAPSIDWGSLRFFADMMVDFSDDFVLTYDELLENMRAETYKALALSEEAMKKDPRKELFVYFPSCEYNTRNLLRVDEVIRYSFFIDFLLSDLAKDLSIAAQKPIELGALSLWRAYLVTTTIGNGHTQLKVDQKSGEIRLDFGMTTDLSGSRDLRERKLLENLSQEQKRFQDAFYVKIQEIQAEVKAAAAYTGLSVSDLSDDFELQILSKNQ